MDNIQFSKTFSFCTFRFRRSHHTDSAAGTVCHHIGRIHSGSARFDVGGREYLFSAGDVFYTPPGCRYHSYWTGARIEYDSFAFHLFPDAEGKTYGVQRIDADAAMHAHLDAILETRRADAAAVGHLYAFLGAALPKMTPQDRDVRREAVAAAQEYMRTHREFSVRALARHLGISESGVYALFRETLHRTPIEEKNRLAVERARELLTTTDRSVDAVAEMLGFSSAAYFRKVLRAETGMTPREIRKNSAKEL